MKKTFFVLKLISFILTVTNFILALVFKYEISSLLSNTENDNQLQYEYLSKVLCDSYFILQVVAFCFDVVYYLLYAMCTFCFCKETNDKNADNVRTKAMKENKMSNLLVEFLFLVLIKGLALGFGFFYAIESVIETKRIIQDITNIQTETQLKILNTILGLCVYIKWMNLITMIYVLWMYGVRLGKDLWKDAHKKKPNKVKTDSTDVKNDSRVSDMSLGGARAINSISSALIEN